MPNFLVLARQCTHTAKLSCIHAMYVVWHGIWGGTLTRNNFSSGQLHKNPILVSKHWLRLVVGCCSLATTAWRVIDVILVACKNSAITVRIAEGEIGPVRYNRFCTELKCERLRQSNKLDDFFWIVNLPCSGNAEAKGGKCKRGLKAR